MTTPPTSPPTTVKYSESIRASWLIIAVISGMLGVSTGTLTAVAVKGGISGGEAAVFYTAMGLTAVFSVFVLTNFTMLIVVVTEEHLLFRYGMFSRKFRFQDIRALEVRHYSWIKYGGWGIRVASGGKRAWSVPFIKTGLAVLTEVDGKEKEYYITSRFPTEFRAAFPSGIRCD